MTGSTHSMTRVNFHEAIKAKTNPIMHWQIVVKIVPTVSPIPCSICSNCACTFVANSKALFESNHPCSWDNIIVKYLFFKLYTALLLIKDQKHTLKK